MKLPNGFGTIVKYTDKPRRRPYVVKKTIDGRQRIVGRFETHADALAFLVDYNKQPAIYGNAITFSEIYSLMARERYPKLAETTRTGEFLAVRKTDVKLRQRYFIVRDSKTEAGRNRPVPISRKALPYFDYWMQTAGQYLINDNGKPLTYHKFRRLFDRVMTASRCRHTPHECRHTLATWLDNAGANETAVKRILGHASQGVTKRVYTHKSLHELKRAIDLL